MKRVRYVFQVWYRSCAGPDWVRQTEFVHDNDRSPVAIAGDIIANELDVTETGVRVEFQGLRADGETVVTPLSPFRLELVRLSERKPGF